MLGGLPYVGSDRVREAKPTSASEDFGVFGAAWQTPSVFWFIGGTDPERYAEAKEAYEAVLRIDPTNSEAQQYIEHYKKTGGTPARTTAPAPQAGEPADLLAEASRRIEEKQYAGAEAILNQMLTKEPGNPRVCQLLARLHLQQGQLQVALGEYRFLAGAALRAQDYPQAETLICEFLAVEPNSVPLLELHGELYEEKGDIHTAVEHYGKAIEVWGKLLDSPEHEGEIGMAVASSHRRAHGKEDEVRFADRRRKLGREADAPIAQIALEQLFETRLVDRNRSAP